MSKVNIRKDLTKRKLEFLSQECNFADDEQRVFDLLASGKSRAFIADELGLSVSAIDIRIRRIKIKVQRVLDETFEQETNRKSIKNRKSHN